MNNPLQKSNKLEGVCYDIRGPILSEAKKMEEQGQRILKLNIGNPAPFGFDAPEDIVKDVIHNLPSAQGYSDASGIYPARVAIMQYYQQKQVHNLDVNNIIVGNGVSELIMMAMQGLLNSGDEVLLPAPDYPLWTAAIKLSSGTPVHYICDEQQGWFPDIDDIKSKINSNTKAIVLINPNNPTGAVYSETLLQQIVELARAHNLVIFSDEIYDKILYDHAQHTCIGSLADDITIVTFSGLSKNYRIAGFRIGWMLISGDTKRAADYLQGLHMLASMRMCANVPCQTAIQTALGGYQSINELIVDGGRLKVQRDLSYQMLNQIDGIDCVKPDGAMYAFAKVDAKAFKVKSDEQMILDLLRREKILLVHGGAFNLQQGCYFRLVFLPHKTELTQALEGIQRFFNGYQQA